ncbi:hypothetical protein HY639_02350 [Candidatus Woesearchaeota archaeon]|nr:hypothetical protein [Candidatus Woesearchaeota archaeon]
MNRSQVENIIPSKLPKTAIMAMTIEAPAITRETRPKRRHVPEMPKKWTMKAFALPDCFVALPTYNFFANPIQKGINTQTQ